MFAVSTMIYRPAMKRRTMKKSFWAAEIFCRLGRDFDAVAIHLLGSRRRRSRAKINDVLYFITRFH